MTALVNPVPDVNVRSYFKNVRSSFVTIADDIAKGFFEITHNSFALLGLAMVFAVAFLIARPDLRSAGEFHLMTLKNLWCLN